MNRQQRRRFAKQLAKNSKGKQTFHATFKTLVGESPKGEDHSKSQWCWRHNLQLDNIDKPTDRDKKLIESVRLRPFKRYEKGKLIMGRSCPRCGNTLILSDPLQEATKSSILEVPQGEEYGNLSMPNMRKTV